MRKHDVVVLNFFPRGSRIKKSIHENEDWYSHCLGVLKCFLKLFFEGKD